MKCGIIIFLSILFFVGCNDIQDLNRTNNDSLAIDSIKVDSLSLRSLDSAKVKVVEQKLYTVSGRIRIFVFADGGAKPRDPIRSELPKPKPQIARLAKFFLFKSHRFYGDTAVVSFTTDSLGEFSFNAPNGFYYITDNKKYNCRESAYGEIRMMDADKKNMKLDLQKHIIIE